MPGQQVKVKKVKAYPIPAQLFRGGATGAGPSASTAPAAPSAAAGSAAGAVAGAGIAGQIRLLTLHGFLCELPISNLQPGEKFQVAFELPVIHKQISESIVMVKLYIQGAGVPGAAATAAHIAEFHFTDLSLTGREAISVFLRQLGKTQNP